MGEDSCNSQANSNEANLHFKLVSSSSLESIRTTE